MKYSKILYYDVGNGPGIRLSLFVSGCNIHCDGCFNKETWDFNYGEDFTSDTLNGIILELSKDYYDGISILGGEPMSEKNQAAVAEIILKIRSNNKTKNKDIWLFTGYYYSSIPQTNFTNEILSNINTLVEGPFEKDKLDKSGAFRGSTNQIITHIR